MPSELPDPAIVVLVGASGAGKSTWAKARYRSAEIVSSDDLRGLVGSGRHDLDATSDAFRLLDDILAARAKRGLTCVVDTLGLDPERRRAYLAVARSAGLPAVAVVFDVPAALARERNAGRDRPVPAPALAAQLAKARAVRAQLDDEGWDDIVDVADFGVQRTPTVHVAPKSTGFAKVLQVSRFPWGEDPSAWLKDLALAADEAGFDGIALMDHLIQIPQVDRAWAPIPEPWVTLGMLAALDTDLRLGTLVSPITFRAPGLTAKAVATLDALSGGRAFLGVGAGWWQREHEAFGLPFPPLPERHAALEAGIETIRALWAPGTKAYDGTFVHLPETTCYPRPVSDIPIVVGGRGRRTLRIAARLGHACNVPSDEASVQRASEIIRAECAAAGRDPDEVAITVLDLPVVGRDRDVVWSRVEAQRGRTAAATFARTHHAGTFAEQHERYTRLAELGVRTVFVSLAHLRSADDVLELAPMLAG